MKQTERKLTNTVEPPSRGIPPEHEEIKEIKDFNNISLFRR